MKFNPLFLRHGLFRPTVQVAKATSANEQFAEMAGKSTSYEFFYVHLHWLSSPKVCGTTRHFGKLPRR